MGRGGFGVRRGGRVWHVTWGADVHAPRRKFITHDAANVARIVAFAGIGIELI